MKKGAAEHFKGRENSETAVVIGADVRSYGLGLRWCGNHLLVWSCAPRPAAAARSATEYTSHKDWIPALASSRAA
jgi:hypothetical protein